MISSKSWSDDISVVSWIYVWGRFGRDECEEAPTDWILDFDVNPERVVHPLTFQTQHSLSSGEEETSIDEED